MIELRLCVRCVSKELKGVGSNVLRNNNDNDDRKEGGYV